MVRSLQFWEEISSGSLLCRRLSERERERERVSAFLGVGTPFLDEFQPDQTKQRPVLRGFYI